MESRTLTEQAQPEHIWLQIEGPNIVAHAHAIRLFWMQARSGLLRFEKSL